MIKETKKAPTIRFRGFTDDWEQRKLGELATFNKGAGYSKSDLKASGTQIILYGHLYTKYETVIKQVDTFVDSRPGSVYSEGGEVIVPASGETAEDIAIASVVEKPGILLGGDLNIIHPIRNLDSTFLAISISNGEPHKEMAKRAQGKSVVHLHNDDLSQIKFRYPSIEEQSKISKFFSNLDNLITLHQRKLDQLKTLKKYFLQNMFPAKGEKVPRIRFKGFTGDWEQRKLGECCQEFKSGSFIPASDIGDIGKYPVYGGNGLRGFSSEYNHDGEFALIGRQGALCGNMNYSVGRAYFTEHAIAVQANKTADTKFLYYLLKKMNLGQYSDQSAQPGLAVGKLVKLIELVPSVAEQIKIGHQFMGIDNLITLHQRKLNQLQTMKKFMLQNLFI